MKKCEGCGAENSIEQAYCHKCGEKFPRDKSQEAALKFADSELLRRAKSVQVFTVDSPSGISVAKTFGIVFGNSSKQAFWGLSTQADRLSRAYDAALLNLKYDAAELGANAVVGVTFALNNSTGSGAAVIAGSSEAVMLIGTAVMVTE